MNTTINHIPKNWQPNNPSAIKKWMEKLPTVYDLAAAERADAKYEYLQFKNKKK